MIKKLILSLVGIFSFIFCHCSKMNNATNNSAKNNNYNSYDLAFFDLHGDVKSFSQDYIDYLNYPYTSEFIEKPLYFNAAGEWTNMPGEFKKDSEGKIVEWDFEIMDGDGFTYFKWKNGRLEQDLRPGRVYSDEGWVLIELGSYDDSTWINVYTDYIFDEKGNWIQRAVHTFPVLFYYDYDEESVEIKSAEIRTDYMSVQNRFIEYHSDHNNFKRPDEISQQQIMKTLKDMSKKEPIPLNDYDKLLIEFGLREK